MKTKGAVASVLDPRRGPAGFFRFGLAGVIAITTLSLLHLGGGRPATRPPGEVFRHPPILAGTKDSIRHVFQVTNSTDRAVKVLDVASSCTCTRTVLSKPELRPGEIAELVVDMQVMRTTAQRVAIVTLHTDHPRLPKWTYRIEAKTYQPVWFDEPTLNMGEFDPKTPGVSRGGTKVHTCYQGPRGDRPTLDWVASPHVRVRVDESSRSVEQDGGWELSTYDVSFELDTGGTSLEHDLISESVTVRYGDHVPAMVRLVARPVRPFSCVPAVAHFGVLAVGGEPRTLDVLVRSQDAGPFRIEGLEVDDPALFASDVTEEAGRSRERDDSGTRIVRLVLRPPQISMPSKHLSGYITLTFDRSRERNFRLPWVAEIQEGRSRVAIDP